MLKTCVETIRGSAMPSKLSKDLKPPALETGQLRQDYHVFICHSGEGSDNAVAGDIENELKKANLKCLNSASGAGSWFQYLEENLKKSFKTIVILSEHLKADRLRDVAQQAWSSDDRNLIYVLNGVSVDDQPAEVRGFHLLKWDRDDPSFWSRLEKGIVEVIPMNACIPAGDVAHGMAWSFFYGFLKLILPGISQRIRKCEFWDDGKTMVDKLFLICPEYGFYPQNFVDWDTNITQVEKLEFKATRAGVINRSYSNTIYKVCDPDSGEAYHFAADFCSPMLALYEMEQSELCGLNAEQKQEQLDIVRHKLEEILNHKNNRECHDSCVMVIYPFREADAAKKDHSLSKALVKMIKRFVPVTA